jgi:hypothetical protein
MAKKAGASGRSRHQYVRVKDVQFDLSNPRIRKFLEMYGEKPTAEQVYFALGAAGDDESDSSTSFDKLKNSIMTNGGIIEPILVNKKPNGKYVCIEGNTRLAIYKNFIQEKIKGDWAEIPALVYENMDEARVDAIRLQVHLVGRRPWDPYSKAKYLHHLRNHDQLPFSAIVDYCGGRKKEVLESIQAFSDMEEFYRPLVTDDEFDTSRFSGFVELQKPGIRESLFKAGFNATDFSKWIHQEKLYPLNSVRALPRILSNAKAKDVFLKQNARAAMQVIEKPDLSKALLEARIGQLAQALTQAIYALPWQEAERIRKDTTDEGSQALNEALIALTALLNPSQSES